MYLPICLSNYSFTGVEDVNRIFQYLVAFFGFALRVRLEILMKRVLLLHHKSSCDMSHKFTLGE